VRGVEGLLVVLTVVVVAASLPHALAQPAPADAAPACVDAPPDNLPAATPAQLRQRYHVDGLLTAHHDGRGQTGVILEFGQSVDAAALDNWEACLGTGSPPLVQTLVGSGSMPAPGGEAQADAQSMVIGAPGLDHLYSLVTNAHEADGLPPLLRGILDGSLTGGRRADVVSLSFGSCEQQWVQDGNLARIRDEIEPLLHDLAQAGIWFFKAAGDAGSSDCSPHDADPNCVSSPFEQQLAVGYPASSPWVTSVGGIELRNGVENTATVWNAKKLNKSDCSGGGGYISSLFPTPAYQARVPDGAVPPARGVPDVSALGGYPGYLSYSATTGWYGNGDELRGAYAGAAPRSARRGRGVAPPARSTTYLSRTTRRLTAPSFNDITIGDNAIYDSASCCAAPPATTSRASASCTPPSWPALLLQATTPTTTSTTTPATPLVPNGAGHPYLRGLSAGTPPDRSVAAVHRSGGANGRPTVGWERRVRPGARVRRSGAAPGAGPGSTSQGRRRRRSWRPASRSQRNGDSDEPATSTYRVDRPLIRWNGDR
jgi:hypothetical protein